MKQAALILLGAISLAHGSILTVQDTKNRPLMIELIALNEDQVVFKKKGGDKEFTLPLTRFAEDSQNAIKTAAKTLPKPLPKIEFGNVTISKIQKDVRRSYYMEEQEIVGSVELKNSNMNRAASPCTLSILVFGQDQRYTDLYQVITNQSFDVELRPGELSRFSLESAFTQYDSDNKGYGNAGGFKFCGYVITLKTEDGRLILKKISGAMPRKGTKNDPTLLEKIESFKTGTRMTDKFETDRKTLSRIGVTRN